jgi:hypothetical protein
MKDGLILFFLALAMTCLISLHEKLSVPAAATLLLSLGAILSLRFYIFYLVVLAIVGTFVANLGSDAASVLRRVAVLAVIGLVLAYSGLIQVYTTDLERYASLEALQRSRADLATRAESGFGSDLDVSTTSGAISALPIGFAYLLLAPFPWEANTLRQAITIPETLVWWSMLPLVVYGLYFTIRHRWREALPMLLFTLMLTLAYSVFQGNVGTAYRQRTQIQLFLVVFFAVGVTVLREQHENRRLLSRRRVAV